MRTIRETTPPNRFYNASSFWWLDRPRAIIYLALLSSVLTIVGYLYSPAGGIVWVVLTNHFLALFAIWITAALLTRAKGAEEALNAARDDLESTVVALNTSQHIAHLGSYERNLLTNKLTWHDEMFRLVGLEPHAFEPTADKFMDFVHPDDRDRLLTVIQAAHIVTAFHQEFFARLNHAIEDGLTFELARKPLNGAQIRTIAQFEPSHSPSWGHRHDDQ